MNAFEPYRNPSIVSREIHRVFRPGAELFLDTVGLQPLHEDPFHFYNVTRYGLTEWLKHFETLELGVSHNFNPIYALSWIVSKLEDGIAKGDPSGFERFNKTTLEELVSFWRNVDMRRGETWDLFHKLDEASREACAAGWEAWVRKPNDNMQSNNIRK